MEIWRDIEGYHNYQVSNLGRVKSLNYNKTGKEKILKNSKNKDGYLFARLYKEGKVKTFKVHRLVAQVFIPNPDNLPQVNHKDENKTNNCVENLEWCTAQYNTNYGTHNERMAKAKSLHILQFNKEGNFIRKWESIRDIERDLDFNNGNISKCCKGKYKTAYGFKWCYHYKSLWEKKHIPLIKQKKVA